MWLQELLKQIAGCDEASLQRRINQLENELGSKTKEYNILQGRYIKDTSEKDTVIDKLQQDMLALKEGQNQELDKLEDEMDELEKEKDLLEAHISILKEASESLFDKPKPAFLTEVEPTKVMLADFVVKTSKGSMELKYPHHSSVFTPSPIFEEILTEAGVNSPNSLQPIQVCNKIANVFHKRIRYEFDGDLWFGRLDNWTPASLVKLIGEDDCESSAMAILSAIFYYQLKFGAFKEYSCFLGLGYLKQYGNMFGHGFVVILHDTSKNLKDSYIIEPTLEFESNAKTLKEVAGNYTCDWGVIGFQRSDYDHGTYYVNQNERWWLGTGGAVVGEKKGIIEKVKDKIMNKPKRDYEKKKQAIADLWKNKKR